MPWVSTEVVGLDYRGRAIYRNVEAEMSTYAQQWMLWHPRDKVEAEAQLKVLRYLLQVTQPLVLDAEACDRIAQAQGDVLALISQGREQVRGEAQALVRYIEEHFK